MQKDVKDSSGVSFDLAKSRAHFEGAFGAFIRIFGKWEQCFDAIGLQECRPGFETQPGDFGFLPDTDVCSPVRPADSSSPSLVAPLEGLHRSAVEGPIEQSGQDHWLVDKELVMHWSGCPGVQEPSSLTWPRLHRHTLSSGGSSRGEKTAKVGCCWTTAA